MKQSPFLTASPFLCLIALLTFTESSHAEMYVAGQLGVNIPNGYSDVSATGGSVNVTTSSLSQQNSMMYGAKLGYYFDSLNYEGFNLGVETEVFNSTPHIQKQPFSANGSIGNLYGTLTGTFNGLNNRVLMWSPFTALVRHKSGAFEPYAGVGLGLFFSNLSGYGASASSDTAVGLNTQLGLKYHIADHLSMFGEWKYNYAKFQYNNIVGTAVNISANYSANLLSFGIAYHF